jgi:hypothetical protein
VHIVSAGRHSNRGNFMTGHKLFEDMGNFCEKRYFSLLLWENNSLKRQKSLSEGVQTAEYL